MKLTHVGKIEAKKGLMVLLLKSKDEAGNPSYIYAAGRVERCLRLKDEYENKGKLDLAGIYVLAQGKGYPPPKNVLDEMLAEHGIRNLSDDEVHDILSPYLKEE